MKKIFTLFAAAMMAVSLFGQTGYGILVNGKMYYQGEAMGEKDYQGRDQFKASVSLAQGDKWCIYDATNKAEFVIFMEEGEGSAKGNFTEGATEATCNVAGCYDFYIKLKWEDNSLWVQTGSNCSATGVDISTDTPGPGPGQPSGDAYWYWKGYVDGKDLNNEMEGGIFYEGLSEITVNDAGYIFVVYQVHGVPGVQYMAAAYSEDTHATLLTSGGEKLKIPAGTHTLYLYDNGNGTVELSREPLAGKTLVGGTQNIENTKVMPKTGKVIVDGELRIVHGDKIFDATGRQL